MENSKSAKNKTMKEKKTKYAYAVIDGNEAPDQYIIPSSFHTSLSAARKERDRQNRLDPNYHYYVIEWHATKTARLRPRDAHYGAID